MTVENDILYGDNEGALPLAGALSTKRQQIIDAVLARLSRITTANGYQTDLGLNVTEWDLTPLDAENETYRIEYRDPDESHEYITVGEHYHKLPLDLRILTAEATPLAVMRRMMADVLQVISHDALGNLDVTLGGLSEDMTIEGDWVMNKGQAADTFAGSSGRIIIEYLTEPWNAFA